MLASIGFMLWNCELMSEDVLYLIETYAKIFAAGSPVAAAAMIIAMTPQSTPKERWAISVRATNVSTCLMLLAAFFGTKILFIMGVDMNAFRIAGGIVLGLVGLDMLRSQGDEASKIEKGKTIEDMIVSPLAFPIISGPGAISSMMIAKSEAINTVQNVYAYVALAALMATYYGCFYMGAFCSKWLKPSLAQISTKLCGLFILAVAAQFFTVGVLNFVK